MQRLRWVATILPLAVACGCGKGEPTKAAATGTPPATQGAAQARAPLDPDLCKEHGVLEALCTKCNPKLAAIFQSKGDWCPEHGFPESVCPTCHPERGGKPAVDVASDNAPADGTKVVLKSADAARLAGIEVARAAAGSAAAGIAAPAAVVFDAGRVAQVTARAPGVVKRVAVEIGIRVAAGATLAIVESPTVGADQSRVAAARSRVQAAEAGFRRESELEKKGIAAKKEVIAAELELQQAKGELAALHASLRTVGAGSGGRYAVKAPLSGVVTQRTVSLDGYVEAGTPLFEIADTSTVAAEVALSEGDVAKVRIGSSVVLTFDGLGEKEYRGKVATIAPAIDPQTRTAKARVRLANHDGELRANLYGTARIAVAGSHGSVAVPQGAVQQVGSVPFVFVRVKPDEFEARRVEVAPARLPGKTVDLASGVEVGEEVVAGGSFFLKTEMQKGAIGAGCCEAGKK